MLHVRRIHNGESDLYRALRLRALTDAPGAFTTTHAQASARSAESWREQTDSTVQGSERATFFAFVDDNPVGLAALYRHPEQPVTGELLQVWVAPEHRGRGAADALLDALFHWGIDEAGFLRVLAEVKANNVRALGFYRRYGFVHRADIQASDPDETVLEWTPGTEMRVATP
jgi:ribosomal protein S18 acetylase RimI-like enzyme